jgi:phosphate uptake regulator
VATHLAKTFSEELTRLNGMVLVMGDVACQQMRALAKAIEFGDTGLARLIIERGADADLVTREINSAVLRLSTPRKAMAVDVGNVFCAHRVATELKQTVDDAIGVARRLLLLAQSNATPRRSLTDIARLAAEVLDEAIESLFDLIQDPQHVSTSLQALFIARDIERIVNRIADIRRTMCFLIDDRLEEVQPNVDLAKMTVAGHA